ncbi:MAG: undecaprenyl-diphosphate phosphatase [Pseudomonadota bacterium]|nr:undecaprenyl-diphosphate phosphatase [Pseudomonadota bacterium]
MGFLYLSFLAIIQGVTEFLPISSSGHLIIIAEISQNRHHNLHFDIAVHSGSLLAVILYYRNEMRIVISGLKQNLALDFSNKDSIFFWLLILATLPVLIIGLSLKLTGLLDAIRSPGTVAFGMIVFGLILYFVDQISDLNRKQGEWTARDAIIMGLWQSVALIPGTSRSGNTITAARLLGFCRESSVNLSMLMSVPTILASSVILFLDVLSSDTPPTMLTYLFAAGVLSFLAAFMSINLLINFIRLKNFTPFVIYRVLFGVVILLVMYSNY